MMEYWPIALTQGYVLTLNDGLLANSSNTRLGFYS